LADLFLFPVFSVFDRFPTLNQKDYPVLCEIKANLEELAVFKASYPPNCPDAPKQ
jgi:glutathione S-transferase